MSYTGVLTHSKMSVSEET